MPTTQDDETTNAISAALGAGALLASADDRVGQVEADGIKAPFLIVPANMRVESSLPFLKAFEERAPAPRRRRGTASFTEIDGFLAHVNRFKDADSVVFANTDAMSLTAVLNYHRQGAAGDPRWGDHRAFYGCPLSEAWGRWNENSGNPMSQDAFGQWIDDHMDDLAAPDPANDVDLDFVAPAKVLELARSLQIHTKGTFERTINPTTGESSLVSKVENEQTSTKIPRAFLLKLPVFEAGVLYRVEARIRFSLVNGRPSFSYHLYQTEAIKRDAFGEVRARVAKETGLPVLAGAPE